MIWNRQFCFDANNYIITKICCFSIFYSALSKMQYANEYGYDYIRIGLGDRRKSKYLSILGNMNWENRNSGNVGRDPDAISKVKI
jgi:hypothetical protein